MVDTLLIPSVVSALFISAILGCTTVGGPESVAVDATEESGSAAQVEDSLTGVWRGWSTCRLGRFGFNCRGMRNVSFSILPLSPSRMKGVLQVRGRHGELSESVGNRQDCANRYQRKKIVAPGYAGRRLKLPVHQAAGARPPRRRLRVLTGCRPNRTGSWWVERS
jgi:hypothetical protein